MVVPKVECDQDEAIPENYVVTTVELGHPTGAQIIEECDSSYQALKDRLLRTEGKYKRLKKEHKTLIGYVQHLARPCGQENPAVDLPAELSRESISNLEDLKKMAQEANKWLAMFARRQKSSWRTSPILFSGPPVF